LTRILSRFVAGWRAEIAARAKRRFAHRTTRWRAGARIETRLGGILGRPIVVRRRVVLRQRRPGEQKHHDDDSERAHQYLRQPSSR
jgi:hypothetical protein